MDPTLPQALHAINGDTLNKKLQDDAGRIAALARGDASSGDIVDELYLSAFSRRPTDDERRALVARLDAATDRRQMVEDFAWALLTSREFLFNH